MFQLIKGSRIPDISGLKEEYQIVDGELIANVSAENIEKVFGSFLGKMREDEPLFLFIEVPCREEEELKMNPEQTGTKLTVKAFHKNIYYLDGYCREDMVDLLNSGVGELLINDGLVSFGFGSLESHIELGKYRYNVLRGYLQGQDQVFFTEIFDELDIPCGSEIVTAWQLISEDSPGECCSYEFEGKDVYTLIDQLKEIGLYLWEIREEE